MKYCHPGDVLVMFMSSSGGLFHVDGRLETGDIIVTINYAETARMTLADIRLLYLLLSDLMGREGTHAHLFLNFRSDGHGLKT